eukprot:SAG22_NODE_553_length_9168_cov_5.758628_10_plen_85_part_00
MFAPRPPTRSPPPPSPRRRLPDYEAIIKLADGFNGADLRNICTEAGMMAIREERAYVIHEDFMKAVRKMTEMKKLEGTLDYKKV